MPARTRAAWIEQKHSLTQRRDAVQTLVDEFKAKEKKELCESLLHYREVKHDLEAQVQTVSETIEAISQALADKFIAEGLSSQNYEDLGTFSLHHKLYVSTANKEEFLTWLKTHQLETLIQEYVPPKTVEALVRERFDNGEPNEGMGLNVAYKVTVR